MDEKDMKKIDNPMFFYTHTKAKEYSQFCTKLARNVSNALRTVLNVSAQETGNSVTFKHLALSVALTMALLSGISLTGLLNHNNAIQTFETEIHSGFWGIIPMNSSKTQNYLIENPSEKPVYLGLKAVNWFPSEAKKYVNILWDYDESPLQPGETVQVNIMLENIIMENNIFVSLDLYVSETPIDN